MDLRYYQKEAIMNARQAMKAGAMAPLIVLPTGAGKTVIFSWIANQVQKNGGRVFIVVHRQEILKQTLKKLYEFDVIAGQIKGGGRITSDNVQVAMVGTLVNRLKVLPKPNLIIFDEAHHTPAGQWVRIWNHYFDTPKLGLTATPERLDGCGLGDMWDEMIVGPDIQTLVDQGFLANPRMFSSELSLDKKYKMKRGDYSTEEQQEQMTKRVIVGDIIEHYKSFLNHMPTVCFCVSINHCEIMVREFQKAGIKAAMVSGKTAKEERENLINGLADGSVEILCSCDIISEGVDVPVMAGAIMLRRTVSLALYIQQGGRPLRLYEGKKNAIILDHCGNVYQHGHILKKREWKLDQEKRENKKKKKDPDITRCPKCYYILPGNPKKCSACGHDFNESKKRDRLESIEAIAGSLSELLPPETPNFVKENLAEFAYKIKNREGKGKGKAIMSKCYQLADRGKIQALGKALGYKPGWSDRIWERISKDIPALQK